MVNRSHETNLCLQCLAPWTYFEGKCYFASTATLNWKDALNSAIANKSVLATIGTSGVATPKRKKRQTSTGNDYPERLARFIRSLNTDRIYSVS